MPLRELTLSSTDNLENVMVFTTAQLRWKPLSPDQPNGAQIATLWGDRFGAFGAVVQSPHDPPDVYTFIRRDPSRSVSSEQLQNPE